jgi:hypothetical protein
MLVLQVPPSPLHPLIFSRLLLRSDAGPSKFLEDVHARGDDDEGE